MRSLLFLTTICFVNFHVRAQHPIKLITLDPGHFHAALVQKSMYPQVDPTVHVYAKKSIDLDMHLSKIKGYNSAAVLPTSWQEVVYEGDDYLSRMLKEKKGNVVVLAGNNQLKTDYILQSIQAGYHVFSDKPMVINEKGFEQLKLAFLEAQKNKKPTFIIFLWANLWYICAAILNQKIMAKIKGAVVVNIERCKGCNLCVVACPSNVLELSIEANSKGYNFSTMVIPDSCVGCAACALVCPDACITVYKVKL